MLPSSVGHICSIMIVNKKKMDQCCGTIWNYRVTRSEKLKVYIIRLQLGKPESKKKQEINSCVLFEYVELRR